MKINSKRNKAFLLIEGLIAMGLFVVIAVAVINSIILCFHQIQVSRHQSFVTQLLVDRTEILRLPSARLSATEVISRYEATTNETYTVTEPDMTYNVKIYTTPWSYSDHPSYSDNIKVVYVKVVWWETPSRRVERIWTTFVTKDSFYEKGIFEGSFN